MSDKLKNLIVRALTGIVVVAIMVTSIINPLRLTCLFLIITGAAMWEYTGLVNKIDGVKVNRFISTVAGAYFFCAVTALQVNMVTGFIVFVPYVLTLIYLFVADVHCLPLLNDERVSLSAERLWYDNLRLSLTIEHIYLPLGK